MKPISPLTAHPTTAWLCTQALRVLDAIILQGGVSGEQAVRAAELAERLLHTEPTPEEALTHGRAVPMTSSRAQMTAAAERTMQQAREVHPTFFSPPSEPAAPVADFATATPEEKAPDSDDQPMRRFSRWLNGGWQEPREDDASLPQQLIRRMSSSDRHSNVQRL